MKRKGFYPQRVSFLKWHTMAFIFFTLLVAYSLVAEITYPGNATVPFGVFRPVIIERLTLILIVGATLLAHFLLQQSRAFLQSRVYHDDLASTDYLADYDDKRLWVRSQANDIESLDEDFRIEKRKRHH